MLIPLNQLISKYDLKITGVIHVGAHWGEEDSDYLNHGILKRYYFEPHPSAYEILTKNINASRKGDVALFPVALGARPGTAPLHVETFNTGQSNSLLQPGTHLKHYPLIKFESYIDVIIKTLDSFRITDCNFLNMDTQGYELEVLKGSTETLQHIDYIYTEVNTDELYIGCGKLHEIDSYLKDFQRLEIVMTGQGWGDAFYIRRKIKTNIQDVPAEFRPHHPIQYPADNDMIFEEWYYQQELLPVDRTYLPIFWTSFYCKYKYGRDRNAINKLQVFINRLDKSKKYYTIVQYDDGILNDISFLDIKVFAMSGNRIDYPLPLICKPHQWGFPFSKSIFCSYIGVVNHPIRNTLNQYAGLSGWYISTHQHSLQQFCSILARSRYVLCPRGYGKTSFRIMESLQYDAIPVYITDDDFIIPHGDSSYMHCIGSCVDIKQFLNTAPEPEMEPLTAFNTYFTYQANKDLIYKNLSNG